MPRSIRENADNGIFKDSQVVLCGDHGLHSRGVFRLGALAARRPDSRATAQVERLCLKGRLIGIHAHFTAEGIQFADQVTFGETAN